MRNRAAIEAKKKARGICQECGSMNHIQTHHRIAGDDSSIVVLCGDCHSKKHPDTPKALFLSVLRQCYWFNKSAASLARELGVHPRTIIRAARRLNIPPGELAPWDEELIRNNIPKLGWQPHRRTPKRSSATKPILPGEVKIEGLLYDINNLPTEYINLSEASRRLQVSYVTLWRWIKKGKVTPVRILGLPYLTLDQVESLKNEKNNQATERPVA